MGLNDALAGGIPYEREKNGRITFYPPCRICGTAVKSSYYVLGNDYTCSECKAMLINAEIEKKAGSSVTKQMKKLDTALKRIAKHTDINKYQEAIEKVKRGLYRPNYYQSTEEIMVALELLHRGYVVYHQVAVSDYRVDFVIPELKVALEIDGRIYHSEDRATKAALRDEVVACHLGEGYEVIHIPTDDINTNVTKLVSAIKAVLAKRSLQ